MLSLYLVVLPVLHIQQNITHWTLAYLAVNMHFVYPWEHTFSLSWPRFSPLYRYSESPFYKSFLVLKISLFPTYIVPYHFMHNSPRISLHNLQGLLNKRELMKFVVQDLSTYMQIMSIHIDLKYFHKWSERNCHWNWLTFQALVDSWNCFFHWWFYLQVSKRPWKLLLWVCVCQGGEGVFGFLVLCLVWCVTLTSTLGVTLTSTLGVTVTSTFCVTVTSTLGVTLTSTWGVTVDLYIGCSLDCVDLYSCLVSCLYWLLLSCIQLDCLLGTNVGLIFVEIFCTHTFLICCKI